MVNGQRVKLAVVAGAAGGMAEVFWISVATTVLGMDGWTVARAVGASLAPTLLSSSFTPWMGLLIHLLLSVALGILFVQTIGHRLRPALLFTAALTSLAAVWAFNFMVLLPLISPSFVTLLPHPVTLISKLLFGLAMAAVLVREH